MKRAVFLVTACAILLALSGCGSVFDKEYITVKDFSMPTAQEDTNPRDKITVSNYTRLKSAILQFVKDGDKEGTIVFGDNYEGDVKSDISNACWQVRSQDALCAYCVQNISYELTKIVTAYEATVSIVFAESAVPMDEILQFNYSDGVENVVKETLAQTKQRLVILIQYGSYTADDMEQTVSDVYYKNPLLCLNAPWVHVNVFTGAGMQRLFEIYINYGYDNDTAEQKKAQVDELDYWGDTDMDSLTNEKKALRACIYLASNCDYDPDSTNSSAFNALLDKKANSEGIALAYEALCNSLGIKCDVVSGQKDWQSHCWNIIRIGNSYYHVDVSECIESGVETGFLTNDRSMWAHYRWDMGSYNKCDGELTYYTAVQ